MSLRSFIDKAPVLKRLLRPIYYRLSGLPVVTEGEISAELLQQCIGKIAPVILEIGANDGTHTAWFRQLFPESTIHCFEPDFRAAKRFRERMDGVERVHLHEVAIGRATGQATFYPSATRSTEAGSSVWHGSGSLRRPTGHMDVHPEIGFADPVTIQSLRLDDWCQQNAVETIDFIWMDVQGAELDVFSGASESLKQCRFIYTEYGLQELHEGQAQLQEILASLQDFKPVVRFVNDILLCNKSVSFSRRSG